MAPLVVAHVRSPCHLHLRIVGFASQSILPLGDLAHGDPEWHGIVLKTMKSCRLLSKAQYTNGNWLI